VGREGVARYWLQKAVATAALARIPRRQLSFPHLTGGGWTGVEVVDEVCMDEEVEEVWKVEGVVVGADRVEISTMVVRISRVEIIVVSTVEAGRVISEVTVEAWRVMSDVTVDPAAVAVVRISKVEVSTIVVKISTVEVLMIVVRISRVEIIVV
jgi:hypothetical protein